MAKDQTEQKPEPTDGICEERNHHNAAGWRITESIPQDSGKPRQYQGHATLVKPTPRGPIPINLDFGIPAKNLSEAFENFDERGKAVLAELNKPKIAIAHLAPPGGNGGRKVAQ